MRKYSLFYLTITAVMIGSVVIGYGQIPMVMGKSGDYQESWRSANKDLYDAIRSVCPLQPSEISALAQSMDNPTESVWTLDRITALGRDAVPEILKCLEIQSVTPEIAIAMFQALGPEAKDTVPFLTDEARKGNERAIDALGAIGEAARPAIPVLLNELEKWLVERGELPPTPTPVQSVTDFRPASNETEPALRIQQQIRMRARIGHPPMQTYTPIIRAIGFICAEASPADADVQIVVKRLMDLVDREPDESLLKVSAITALGQIGPAAKQAIPLLIPWLGVSDRKESDMGFSIGGMVSNEFPRDTLAMASQQALASIGQAALPAVMELVHGEDAQKRTAALTVMFYMPGIDRKAIVAPFIREDFHAYRDGDADVDMAALSALALLDIDPNDDEALAFMIGRIPDMKSRLTHRLALQTVATMGIGSATAEAATAMHQLIETFKPGGHNYQFSRVFTILDRCDPEGAAAYREQLKAVPEVTGWGLADFLLMDDPTTESALHYYERQLHSESGSDASIAMNGLDRVVSKSDLTAEQAAIYYRLFVDTLLSRAAPAIQDGDAYDSVRYVAVRGLGHLGRHAREIVPMLRELLKDSDVQVRREAVIAIAKIQAG